MVTMLSFSYNDCYPVYRISLWNEPIKYTVIWHQNRTMLWKSWMWITPSANWGYAVSHMLTALKELNKLQQEHNNKKTFEEEYRSLLLESGIKIDERYFPWVSYSAPSELGSVSGWPTPSWHRGLFTYCPFRVNTYRQAGNYKQNICYSYITAYHTLLIIWYFQIKFLVQCKLS